MTPHRSMPEFGIRRTAVFALTLAILAAGCSEDEKRTKKVMILGFDGMDYGLVLRMLDEGRLPNLARLRDRGGFRPLTTSIPPQSPVAWSNFITGAGPGVHGIFDFIHRDPKGQATPYFSTNRVTTVEEKAPWEIGKYRIQRSKAENRLLRRGVPFWDALDERGIPVRMYRLPANYPPSKSQAGHMCCLSGMGVPDAFGSQGTYQHFTSRLRAETRPGGGMQFMLEEDPADGAHIARLRGPTNENLAGSPEMTLDVKIYPDPEHDVAKLVYVNEGIFNNETVELILDVGRWSPWTRIHFQKTPFTPAFRTMARFLLQQLRPQIELYATPLNFVPTAPETVFSEPADFVETIGRAVGPFYTQGFAEDFKARDHEIFTDEEYRAQCRQVLEERLTLLDHALERFQEGLLFFYFSSTDTQAHIFWWDSDEEHPIRTPADAAKYHAVIEDLYVEMDEVAGRCMERLGDDATFIVMSDHGFCQFRRSFSVNTWLRNEGYLVAYENLLYDADWSRTRAYGLGLNGLYLNLRGRERDGIVDPAERDALLAEISRKLLAVRDPENGEPVIRRVYRADACYAGPEADNAPDLIIGYERGYRASDGSALGGVDEGEVQDNSRAWSADHCIAHDLVPGILLSNRAMSDDAPALIDVAPSVLAEFGIPKTPQMTGRSFFERPTEKSAGS